VRGQGPVRQRQGHSQPFPSPGRGGSLPGSPRQSWVVGDHNCSQKMLGLLGDRWVFHGAGGGGPWLCKASRTWFAAGKPCSQPQGTAQPIAPGAPEPSGHVQGGLCVVMLYFSGFVEVIIIIIVFCQGWEASCHPRGQALLPLLRTPPALPHGASSRTLWCDADGEQRQRQAQTQPPSPVSARGTLGSQGCPRDAERLQRKTNVKIRSNLDILVVAFPPRRPVCFLTCACVRLRVRLRVYTCWGNSLSAAFSLLLQMQSPAVSPPWAICRCEP